MLEKLIVLFGKSGLGKTSLVQAGAIPLLQERDMEDGIQDYRIETIRFGSYSRSENARSGFSSETPVQRLRAAIMGKKPAGKWNLGTVLEDDGSPWYAAKYRQMAGDQADGEPHLARTLILIFDQRRTLYLAERRH